MKIIAAVIISLVAVLAIIVTWDREPDDLSRLMIMIMVPFIAVLAVCFVLLMTW